MALISLPTEIIEMIIMQAMPEGFESMALCCKRVHAICVPFIEEHNALHSRFHHFAYFENMRRDLTAPTIITAFDLITRIADEPRTANYIRSANFRIDGRSKYALYREGMKDDHGSDAVRRLFADSLELKEAGLDWQTYYAEIEEDLQAARYSQHAAAFLLTLLINVENLYLPKKWKPNDATDKLINVVVRKAKQSQCLAYLKKLKLSVSSVPQDHCELNWVSVFLGLPRIQSFRGTSCVAMDDGDMSTAFKIPYNGFAINLETVDLVNCSIDEISITEFLKRSPNLKTFRYSHSTKENVAVRDWNICKFVNAIEREAGNHLQGLSVSIHEYGGSIASGKVLMKGFQRLQKLELPLDIAIYTRREIGDNELLFIDDFIPASVSQLSFISNGSNDHATILDVMFREFADRKKKNFILPALERIFLACPFQATDVYKEQCASLRTEIEKAGVALELMSSPAFPTITWDGGD